MDWFTQPSIIYAEDLQFRDNKDDINATLGSQREIIRRYEVSSIASLIIRPPPYRLNKTRADVSHWFPTETMNVQSSSWRRKDHIRIHLIGLKITYKKCGRKICSIHLVALVSNSASPKKVSNLANTIWYVSVVETYQVMLEIIISLLSHTSPLTHHS